MRWIYELSHIGITKMSKKLPHQITLEELLIALENTDDNTSELISYKNDVPNFLSKFKIEAGENFLRPRLLYKLYEIYSKEPVDKITFTKTCGDFIPFNGLYFKTNIAPVKLTKILTPQTNRNELSSASIKSHYEAFLKVAEITAGSKWVEGFMLYELYRFYCIDAKKAKRLRYENFVTISKLYFENKRIGESKGRWFKLHENVLDIFTDEHILKIKESRKMSDKHKLRRKI